MRESLAKNEAKLVFLDVLSVLRGVNPQCEVLRKFNESNETALMYEPSAKPLRAENLSSIFILIPLLQAYRLRMKI